MNVLIKPRDELKFTGTLSSISFASEGFREGLRKMFHLLDDECIKQVVIDDRQIAVVIERSTDE